MKRFFLILLCIVMILPLGIIAAANNGAPEGEQFNLNIIGVKNPKDNMDDISGGKVIFVMLDENNVEEPTKIWLDKSDTFMVTDKNGTDGEAAFSLPVPGTEIFAFDIDGNEISTGTYISNYSVYARPLGKPSTTLSDNLATFTTFADLINGDFDIELSKKIIREYVVADDYADYTIQIVDWTQISEPLEFTRKRGQSKFQDITTETLTVVFDVSLDIYYNGEYEKTVIVTMRIPILHEMLSGEFWQYDNDGLKLLQIRFYYDVTTSYKKGKR